MNLSISLETYTVQKKILLYMSQNLLEMKKNTISQCIDSTFVSSVGKFVG